jgi:hypothetical protein
MAKQCRTGRPVVFKAEGLGVEAVACQKHADRKDDPFTHPPLSHVAWIRRVSQETLGNQREPFAT